MDLNDNQLVTLLLTTALGISDKNIKPLSLGKWNKLVSKIVKSELKEPANLLKVSLDDLKIHLSLKEEEADEIYILLKKGAQLAISLEELNKRGIYVLCRGDENYPILIREKLKEHAPAVIFYSGNLNLLNSEAISMVGSRNIDSDILDNTKFICERAVEEKLVVVSGGAKGVDSVSESASYDYGGSFISFIADSLVNRIKKKEVRDKIGTGRALYMTVDNPNYPFTVGRAMNRNKYIYSLAKGTFILNSDYNKGGTWTGAIENLKKGLSLTLVLDNNSKGNKELIKQGGVPIELESKFSIKSVLERKKEVEEKREEVVQLDMFADL